MIDWDIVIKCIDALSKLVSVLAWPAVVLLLARWFKGSLTILLQKLVEFTFPGGAFKFSEGVLEAKAMVDEVSQELFPAAEPHAVAAEIGYVEEPDKICASASVATSAEEQNSSVDEKRPTVKRILFFKDPATNVVKTWENLERSVRGLIKDGVSPELANFPVLSAISVLSAQGIIDEKLGEVLRRLVGLRDLAVSEPNQITVSAAREYVALAEDVAGHLRRASRKAVK